MKRILVLLASTAVLLPAAPAGAFGMPDLPGGDRGPDEPGVCCASNKDATLTITNCSKTRHGVSARIRIRDEGSRGLVRVSHPRGDGRFREPRVRSVFATMGWFGETPPPGPDGSQLGGGVSRTPYGDKPSFRTSTRSLGTTYASVKFKLRNGKSFNMTCEMR